MKREEIREKIPQITGEALDWLMAQQGQELEKKAAENKALTQANRALQEKLSKADACLADYDPQWRQKARAEGLNAQLSAAILRAGGRSEKAIRALVDTESLADAQDPAKAAEAAVREVKTQHAYLFETAAPAAYFAPAGTQAAGEGTDSALRAAFGLEG